MQIILTADDLAAFSRSTRDEILRRFGETIGGQPPTVPIPAPEWRDRFEDVHISNLEDLTFKAIHRWIDGVSEPVRLA
jgi:hypothetical protein